MSGDFKKKVQVYYGFQFFFSLFLWLPIFYEYQRRVGLSDQQIFTIQSIYYWVFCFLEIPTGILADRWGHRICMQAGSVILILAGVFPLIGLAYFGFLLHFLLMALSRSLISGASSAYLYEFLQLHGVVEQYRRIEGNARAYSLLGKVILWPLAGIFMQWRLSLPYEVTLAVNAVAVGFAYYLPRFESSKVGPQKGAQGFRVLMTSPLLPWVMIQGIAIFTLSRIVQINLFQPLLNQKGVPLSLHGSLMALMTLAETWGSFSFPLRRYSDLNAVFIFTLILCLSLMILALGGGTAIWIGLLFFSYATGASFPVQKQLVNDMIPDARYRATFLSMESILDRAACASVAGVLGSVVAGGTVDQFLLISASVSFVGVVILYGIIRRRILQVK